MKRWTSVSPTNEEHRWTVLSRLLKEAGVENEYVKWDGPTREFADISVLDGFDHVRLSTSVGPKVLALLKVRSTWATLIGVIDGMVNTNGVWWPLCALYESYGQILVRVGKDMDKRGSVLVAGAGGVARTAIAAFFRAGFKNFLLTNLDVEEAGATIEEVNRKLFGLAIEWVPTEKIVLLPGECAALVNCTPSIDENPLLRELSYLNFLKRPGFLFDSSRHQKASILMEEAVESEVTVINGIEIGARTDVLWAKWAFGVDLDLDSYTKEFQANLEPTEKPAEPPTTA
ncbi:MAG: hypothetical protein AB7F86_03660 [Bdellovibrionales bacterium]